MRARSRAGYAAAAIGVLSLTACLEEGAGYVEIKAFPGFAAPLYLDKVRVGELKNGVTVLRQAVGRTSLQLERNGHLLPLCEFEVRKNRIITLSLSLFDRIPRCDVKR
jgi:hypothetical protein